MNISFLPESKRFWTWATIISLSLALLSLAPMLIHLIEHEPDAIKAKNAIGFAMWSVFAFASWRKWMALKVGEQDEA